jgi:ketosteroid isomerase-like protein
MPDLRQLTKNYIAAFDAKDLARIEALLHEDFTLEDPAGRFIGRDRVLAYIGEIFKTVKDLQFKARNIFLDGSRTIIEFSLTLDEKRLIGSDVIEWEGPKMKALRAYLYDLKWLS